MSKSLSLRYFVILRYFVLNKRPFLTAEEVVELEALERLLGV